MMISVRGDDVLLTDDTILKTRQWFVDNCRACIDEAVSGAVRVNDIAAYINWNNEHIKEMESGGSDKTFTFIQRAWFIQTGECVPLLS